jgi:hypothetical protein
LELGAALLFTLFDSFETVRHGQQVVDGARLLQVDETINVTKSLVFISIKLNLTDVLDTVLRNPVILLDLFDGGSLRGILL